MEREKRELKMNQIQFLFPFSMLTRFCNTTVLDIIDSILNMSTNASVTSKADIDFEFF